MVKISAATLRESYYGDPESVALQR